MLDDTAKTFRVQDSNTCVCLGAAQQRIQPEEENEIQEAVEEEDSTPEGNTELMEVCLVLLMPDARSKIFFNWC